MTKDEAIAKLAECQTHGDTEIAHEAADGVLCALLEELGCGDVVAEYRKLERWFA